MRGKKVKRLVLKKWIRVVYICILCFFAVFGIYLIFNGLFPNVELTPYYNYCTKSKIDYKVYLKDNDFFEEKFLTSGKQYTTEIIDYIDIDYSYLFNGSKVTNFKYNYDITGEIIGDYENTSSGKAEIWKKKYTLLQKQDRVVDNMTEMSVNHNLKLDYKKYNDIVNNFKNRFKLAIDANFNIYLNINYEAIVSDVPEGANNVIKGKEKLLITVPLSKSTIEITNKLPEDACKNITPDINDYKEYNKVYVGICLIAVSVLAFVLNKNKLIINTKSEYIKIKEKLLKEYSEIIVSVSSELSLDDLEIIDIEDFDDMVDVEEELKSPIMLYEIEENYECWFIVIKDNYAYRYVLKNIGKR